MLLLFAVAHGYASGTFVFGSTPATPIFSSYTSHGHGLTHVIKGGPTYAKNAVPVRTLVVAAHGTSSAVAATNGQGKAAAL